MRTIKTGIAVFLCMLISQTFRLEYPFYAAIAAIISTESSVSLSFKTGKNRMSGTLIGAVTGSIFAFIQPNNALLCGLGVVVLIYLCNLLKWPGSISIAGIVFIAIMVNLDGKSPLLYGLNRIIDTLIGISVALIVNYLVFPYNLAGKIYKDRQVLFDKVSQIINPGIFTGMEFDFDFLKGDIADLKQRIDIYLTEFRIKKTNDAKIHHLQAELEVLDDIYEHLKMIRGMGAARSLNLENRGKLSRLDCFFSTDAEYPGDDINIVYNYHVGKIFDDWRNIQSGNI
jgi:uncharacterized membrane protein YgaE (UPF0421/DUF939 family)